MRRLRREEDGVIALATTGFIVMAGMTIITLLWQIGWVTGAYNQLYIGTQAAAQAAAGRAYHNEQKDSSSGQITFYCGGEEPSSLNSFACGNGTPYPGTAQTRDAAIQALARIFNSNPDRTGHYGLWWSGPKANIVMVKHAPPNQEPEETSTIEAYPMTLRSALATQSGDCGQSVNEPYVVRGGSGVLICWWVTSHRGAIIWPPQYESGVIVRTRALLRLPRCRQGDYKYYNNPKILVRALCPTWRLYAVGSARISQVVPPATWNDFTDYAPA